MTSSLVPVMLILLILLQRTLYKSTVQASVSRSSQSTQQDQKDVAINDPDVFLYVFVS